jgi:hypothetical protein
MRPTLSALSVLQGCTRRRPALHGLHPRETLSGAPTLRPQPAATVEARVWVAERRTPGGGASSRLQARPLAELEGGAASTTQPGVDF